MTDIWDRLAAPFRKEAVSWRAQTLTKNGDKALALAYLDARDVRQRLNEVVGHANWKSHHYDCGNGRLGCSLSIRVDGEWIEKTDGAGDTQVEAEKGAFSGALKRAAVAFGIGEYLYNMPNVWVPCEAYEKNGKWVWTAWKDDPWKYVRNPDMAPEATKPSPQKPKEEQPQRLSKNESRQFYADMQAALDKQQTLAKLKELWIGLQTQIKELPVDWEKELTARKDRCKNDLERKEQGLNPIVPPDFSQLQPNEPDHLEELIGPNGSEDTYHNEGDR